MSPIEIDFQYLDASPENHEINDDIFVRNDLPDINSATAQLVSTQFKEINGNLFFLGNISDPIELELDISAEDQETRNLLFGCQLKSASFINTTNYTNKFNYYINNIKYNKKYSLLASARDDYNISYHTVDIIFNGESYDKIWTQIYHYQKARPY